MEGSQRDTFSLLAPPFSLPISTGGMSSTYIAPLAHALVLRLMTSRDMRQGDVGGKTGRQEMANVFNTRARAAGATSTLLQAALFDHLVKCVVFVQVRTGSAASKRSRSMGLGQG